MDIKIGQSQSNVVVIMGENKYPLRRPKIKEAKHLQLELKRAKDGEISYFDAVQAFLVGMGLPGEIFDELDLADAEKIISELGGGDSKKN